MWKLTKLEIKGFKSFAEPAELDFPEGITAVVGPNGCGKSNISDAILWVLGEQSTRALRAQRMQDVIFQGSASRKATGIAEVTLRLSNGHGNGVGPNGNGGDPYAEARGEPATGNGSGPDDPLDGAALAESTNGNGDGDPVSQDLLTITRRLYRSGDSEYLIDGERCRLRDIRDRLAGTGLGERACFTIGQGNIDQILSASPVDRRAPIEEAAGITLYRHRRHLTQLKLEAAAQDLARVDDICDEVARQMRSLKRQAGRARRYKKLRDQLRELEKAWLSAAYTEAIAGLRLAEAGMAGSQVAEDQARQELSTIATELADGRRQLEDGRAEEQARRQRLYQSQLRHERLRAEARRQEDRLAFAEQRVEEIGRRLEELDERVVEAESLLSRRQQAASETEAAAGAARAVLREAEQHLENARDRAREAREAADAGDSRAVSGRILAAHLEVREQDHGPLTLALGQLLYARVFEDDDLAAWLEEVLEGTASATSLRAASGALSSPPPADDRIVGSLLERIEARTPMGRAVLSALLHDTWLVKDAADAPELAPVHPGSAFVDTSGSCWARGPEVRVRGRQAELADVSFGKERTREQPAGPALASPEEIACREARDRAATAVRAAESQARASKQEVAIAEAATRRLLSEGERIRAEIDKLRDAAETSRRQAQEAEEQAEEAAREAASVEQELDDTVSDDRASEARVTGLEVAQAEARLKVERSHDARSKWEVKAAEARSACGHLETQIRERLELEPAELLTPPEAGTDEKQGKSKPQDESATEPGAGVADARALREQILDAQKKIERLGPVNLVAYEELQENEGRYEDLDSQRRDLREATRNLQAAIERMDSDCVARFAEAFDAINGYFNRIFRQLFGGGRAGMRLENPEDPLNSGIEIFAQPPGKRLQNIRLLSGGERTLVALALLFAIFEYHPSAFCILDEADAALDEANIDRFVRALNNYEDRTQFILITHNKRTMEIADLLYGVTMQESGVSKLVSVALN